MAKKTIFEQHQSGGTAAFLITDTQTIDLDTDLSDPSGDTQTVSITKMHWSGEVSIQIQTLVTDNDGVEPGENDYTETYDVDFTLYGNGAWCQFNGWTPVDCSGDIKVTIPDQADGSLFIEIKKLAGFAGRNDYSN